MSVGAGRADRLCRGRAWERRFWQKQKKGIGSTPGGSTLRPPQAHDQDNNNATTMAPPVSKHPEANLKRSWERGVAGVIGPLSCAGKTHQEDPKRCKLHNPMAGDNLPDGQDPYRKSNTLLCPPWKQQRAGSTLQQDWNPGEGSSRNGGGKAERQWKTASVAGRAVPLPFPASLSHLVSGRVGARAQSPLPRTSPVKD